MLRSFRYLLLPVSILYAGIIWLRNKLFDKDYLKSASFNFPIICVGNLAVGGTGKTPMVEYLIQLLGKKYQLATLSRGYKRKTKGFGIAADTTTALDIGDEPMQFHQKFPHVTVAVGEERLVAIPQLLHDRPNTQVIVLDDAFQHRQVKAGLNILLTEYKNLYTRDFLVPAGDLRDIRSSAKRAEIIVITKCKPQLSEEERDHLVKEINPLPHQQLYFTNIVYDDPTHLFTGDQVTLHPKLDVLLVCGIANPKPLNEYLNQQVHSFDLLRFPDHHIFNSDDLADIIQQFDRLKSTNKIILTTEKDAVRLQKFEKELRHYPIYVMAIQHSFMFGGDRDFDQSIEQFIRSFSSSPQPQHPIDDNN